MNPNVVAIIATAGIVVSVAIICAFLMVKRSEDAGWSLSSAMSEIIGYDEDGRARYVSSSSRFIALFGFILMFWLYLAVGLLIIVNNGTAPKDIGVIERFLFFGLAMFAPYFANQARAAIVNAGKGIPLGLPSRPAGPNPPEASTR